MTSDLTSELLSQFADIIDKSDSPLGIIALLALLLATLAYLFFRNERTKVKATVFGLVFLGSFVAGQAVLGAYATESQEVKSEPIPDKVEGKPLVGNTDAPKRYLVPLDGIQSRSVATWANGTRSASFDCPREHPVDFDLVVVAETSQNIGKRRGKCVGGGSYCDSTTEYCVEYFFKDACYISSEWHAWYKSHIAEVGIPYSKEAVCAK
jgi:hypothetical protein